MHEHIKHRQEDEKNSTKKKFPNFKKYILYYVHMFAGIIQMDEWNYKTRFTV